VEDQVLEEFELKDNTVIEDRLLSYVKSIYSKDTFPQQYCHYNIFETSLSSIMAILLATCSCSGNATTQVSNLS